MEKIGIGVGIIIKNKEDKILIPRAKNAREFLVKKLNEISNVTEVVTYESVMDDSKKEEAISALEEGNLDYITFASSSTVTNFINLIGEENKDKLSLNDDEIDLITRVIASHMGIWNKDYNGNEVLPIPKDKYQRFVHMCDFLSSKKFINVKFDGIDISDF